MGNVALNRRCTIICQSRKTSTKRLSTYFTASKTTNNVWRVQNVQRASAFMHVSLECVGMIWIFCMFCWIYTFLSTQRKKIVFFYYQMCVDVVWQNILVYSNIAQRSIQILDQYFKIYNIEITNNVEIWEPVCRLKFK